MANWANLIIASFLRPTEKTLFDDYVREEHTKQYHEFNLQGERMYPWIEDKSRPDWVIEWDSERAEDLKYDQLTIVFKLGGNQHDALHPMKEIEWFVNNCFFQFDEVAHEQFDVFELCFGNMVVEFVSNLGWKKKSFEDIMHDYNINFINCPSYTLEHDDVILNTVIKFQ